MTSLPPGPPGPTSSPVPSPIAPPDLDGLRDELLAATAAAPTPTRARALALRVVVIGLALGAMGLVLALAGTNLGQRPTGLVLGTLAGAVALAAVALWLTLGVGRSMLGRPWRLLILALLAVPVLLFVWKSAWTAVYPGMDDWDAARPGFRCLGWSLAMALGPLTAFVWLHRHTAAHHPATLGAALGMAAGASSWSLLDLYCPIGHPTHLLVGHVLPMALLAAIGVFVGRWAFRGPRV